ncbi:hypothetical protein PoB_000487200 [Plakobranchus ocellatus]|uniref:Uncharacterized protein n=1 Tax=Plakobranchus ocellatus TaxID=259542 RepID=A0AAV3Y8B6_9GAST|nr:hypothetical protein PoB_000487200 [Plakobranchus ocellatus]
MKSSIIHRLNTVDTALHLAMAEMLYIAFHPAQHLQVFCTASPQQSDLRLLSGQDANGRTAPTDLRADSLSTVPLQVETKTFDQLYKSTVYTLFNVFSRSECNNC